ncbi:MAG: hypothetical protein ACJ79K_15870 [Gemmatimonadaceae bacterium]
MRRSTMALALLLATGSAGALARAQSPASVGERVRVTTPAQKGAYRYVGSVSAATRDSLTVQTADAGARTVAVANISKLEVSRGRRGNGRRGMLYGSVIGIGAGALLGAATYKKPECAGVAYFCPGNSSADITAGGLVGGVVGLAVGGIWGATHPSERWAPRSLGAVGLAPAAHGVMLRVSAAF